MAGVRYVEMLDKVPHAELKKKIPAGREGEETERPQGVKIQKQ